MNSYDVIVVGGGPAGSTCAWKLRELGFDVLVLDRQSFPRDKTCAGWITPPVLKELEIDTDEYRSGRAFQPITGFRVGMIGGRDTVIGYDEPVSFGIRRCEFDHFLLERSGAHCRLGVPITSIERKGECWIIDGELRAPMLVGAGGHFCPVARRLGSSAPVSASVVTAQEVEFEIPAADRGAVRVDPQIPEIYFCEDLQGYGWCFRKEQVLNIGLGRVNGHQLTAGVVRFLEFLRKRDRLRIDPPRRFHGHAYRLYEGRAPTLFDDGVLLVGDAAGLAYPQSGEGIRPAVESGLLAADTIRTANGQNDRETLSMYGREIASWFGEPVCRQHAAWLPAGWLRFVASRLLSTDWFSRRVVLDRWFLHRDVPPLPVSGHALGHHSEPPVAPGGM